MPKADGGRDRLETNDISLRDTIFYFVKRYFCRRKNDISQGETIFAKARCADKLCELMFGLIYKVYLDNLKTLCYN